LDKIGGPGVYIAAAWQNKITNYGFENFYDPNFRVF
jgi:hypothetical protein